MRVLITGGTGRIGRVVTRHLVECGWDVRVLDIQPPEPDLPVEYSDTNILDYDGLRQQMQGCDAVVHLAAIPSPIPYPAPKMFEINVTGTFNVFEAAAKENVGRVVQASSINAIGCAWNIGDFAPQYLPIDEAHPRVTTDPYSFSKQMIEDVGDYYWRRDGISSVGLRFPAVMSAEYRQSEDFEARRQEMTQLIDEFSAQPQAEREGRLAELHRLALEFRATRPLEYEARHNSDQSWPPKPPVEDPLWLAYTFDRFNLWAMIDERDAARSVEKSLTADYEGSHPLFVNDAHNWLNYDSHTLARLFFPSVKEWKQAVTGSESLVSIDGARQLIGFEPMYDLFGAKHD